MRRNGGVYKLDHGYRNLLNAVAMFAVYEPLYGAVDFGVRLDAILSALSRDTGLPPQVLRLELRQEINKVLALPPENLTA